jgi:hypothetical protein
MSAHFSVKTNHSEAAARRLAELLERHHQLWRQLFVRHWASDHALRLAFAGRSLPWPTRQRHQVVLFATRPEFIKHLQPLEPQIDVALGVYRAADRVTYFYEGETDLVSTWVHEATHQLFQETIPTQQEVGADGDFWLVEAAAMYLESARLHDGYFTVGGIDAPRLQVARYRQRQEQFYMPIAQLSKLGKSQLQSHPEIRRLYTQSAGLGHFLMDGRDGAYRVATVEALSDLYSKSRKHTSLLVRLAVEPARLDAQYHEFLDVTDADLAGLSFLPALKQLTLGGTSVTDEGLRQIQPAVQLEWLDLAGLPITDRGIAYLTPSSALLRLNLDGTQVTDRALEHLSQFSGLEELDVSGTRVSNAGLAHLNRLHNLRGLWLANTAVTHEGLERLLQLRRLTRIDLTGTKIRLSELQSCQQKRPDITFSGL